MITPPQSTRPFALWRRLPALEAAVDWSRRSGIQAWLIGGALRDLLLERTPHDWDLAVAGDPAQAARSLADFLGGTVVELNERFQQYRVVKRAARTAWQFDLQGIGSSDISSFLRRRDFTINALAWSLTPGAGVYDPTGGLRDLVHRRLRLLPGALRADPVRALRGLRHTAELQVRPGVEELHAFSAAASAVRAAAAERVRDELFRLLDCWPGQARWVRLGLDWVLGPDAGRAARIGRLESVADEPAEGGRRRRSLVLLAAACSRDQGETGRRLRLTRREMRFMAAWEHLASAPAPDDCEAWLAALWPARGEARDLNALAAAAGQPSLRKTAGRCADSARRLAGVKPLLDGAAAGRISGLQGPALGRLLAHLAARQALGLIRTRAQAVRWAGNCRE